VFIPVKPFQPSLMFAGKAGAYPSEALYDAPLQGRPLVLLINIRLGWKSLPGMNTLAYYKICKLRTKKFALACSQEVGGILLLAGLAPSSQTEGSLLRNPQWKGSNHKQSARWQHLSRLKASAFCIW
jgi:hypothetical protein